MTINSRLVLIPTSHIWQYDIIHSEQYKVFTLVKMQSEHRSLCRWNKVLVYSHLLYLRIFLFFFYLRAPPLPERESKNIVCQLTGSSDRQAGDRLTGGMQNISLIPVTYSTPTWAVCSKPSKLHSKSKPEMNSQPREYKHSCPFFLL